MVTDGDQTYYGDHFTVYTRANHYAIPLKLKCCMSITPFNKFKF